MAGYALKVDVGLYDYCTPRQKEVLEAIEIHGGATAAAKVLGCDKTLPAKTYNLVKAKAAKQGYAPDFDMSHPVPDGFIAKGISTYYNSEGKPTAQWVKASVDQERQKEFFENFIRDLCEPIKGLSPLIAPPSLDNDKLLSVYPIGDQHHGMYAEAEQTGTEYNTDISARSLTTSIDFLCAAAPNSGTALLLDVGDFHHANCSNNETPASRHAMHVTASYGKVMRTGAMALVHCTMRLLEKHQNVVVWIMPGNHNPDAAFATALAISFYFHNEPRVTVDLGNSAFKFMRFGKNLIASHHGDGPKFSNLPLIMAVDRPQDWAETEYRVWHCGHIHHKTFKEEPGCDIETHRTLAPSNSWDHKKGYRSKREMQRIDYHSDLGECNRQRCDAKMLEAMA
jgi:hypothetical protein